MRQGNDRSQRGAIGGRRKKLIGALASVSKDAQGSVQLAADNFSAAVVRAWNLCGGDVRVGDIDVLAEIVGTSDIELLLHGLVTIRDRQRQQSDEE